ncbi:hypothetical protein DFH28DRAFT_979998 [Melampsora americana]|nr:hypothetical protein DFH28DRAFT_979998 [Melampsora americana]
MHFLFNHFLICATIQTIFGDKLLTQSLALGSDKCIGKDCVHSLNLRYNTIEKRQRNAAPPSPPMPAAGVTNVKDESKEDQKRWLDAHNKFRATYKAPPLTWNDQITPAAKAVVKACVFEHSKGPYGENLAAGQTSIDRVVTDWVNGPNEKSSYNPSKPSFSHFTR